MSGENQPRVIVTRPADQAEEFCELLVKAHLEPVLLPVIETESDFSATDLEEKINNFLAGNFTGVVFTSQNACRYFLGAFEKFNKIQKLKLAISQTKLICVGAKTSIVAEELLEKKADLVPKEFSAQGLVDCLEGLGDLQGTNWLFPVSAGGLDTAAQGIRDAGGKTVKVIVYKTKPRKLTLDDLSSIHEQSDMLCFFSPSAVKSFFSQSGAKFLTQNTKIISIGPITSNAIKEVGANVLAEARDHSAQGMLREIQQICKI